MNTYNVNTKCCEKKWLFVYTGIASDVRPMANRPVVDPPALSQITCLGGPADETDYSDNVKRNLQRKDETSFVKLCREGGHKGK